MSKQDPLALILKHEAECKHRHDNIQRQFKYVHAWLAALTIGSAIAFLWIVDKLYEMSILLARIGTIVGVE